MNIDPSTNLPELPEGYFWRIAPGDKSYEKYVRVQLRKTTPAKLSRFLKRVVRPEFSKVIGWNFANAHVYEVGGETLIDTTLEEDILDTAKDLFDKHLTPPPLQVGTELFGDYPPRKLGDSA